MCLYLKLVSVCVCVCMRGWMLCVKVCASCENSVSVPRGYAEEGKRCKSNKLVIVSPVSAPSPCHTQTHTRKHTQIDRHTHAAKASPGPHIRDEKRLRQKLLTLFISVCVCFSPGSAALLLPMTKSGTNWVTRITLFKGDTYWTDGCSKHGCQRSSLWVFSLD